MSDVKHMYSTELVKAMTEIVKIHKTYRNPIRIFIEERKVLKSYGLI